MARSLVQYRRQSGTRPYSLACNGVSGYAYLPSSADAVFPQNTGVFSYAAWYKMDTPLADCHLLGNTAPSQSQKGMMIQVAPAIELFYIALNNGNIAQTPIRVVSIYNFFTRSVLSNWFFVGVTLASKTDNFIVYRGSAGTLTKFEATATSGTGDLATGNSSLLFCIGSYAGSRVIDGNFCDVLLHNAVLSESQMQMIFSVGPQATGISYTHYWPIIEGSGTTCADYGTGNRPMTAYIPSWSLSSPTGSPRLATTSRATTSARVSP